MAKKLFIFFIIILVLLPLLMFLVWFLKPEKKLNVFILDKTVLTNNVQEHISLSWILNYEKYIHSITGKYNPVSDYLGFFPDGKGEYSIRDLEKYSKMQLDSVANVYDVAYYTDLYGVYSNEWIAQYYPEKTRDERFISQRSTKYYGGLTKKELDFLRLMKKKHKLIINEFNIIASPTSSAIRYEYEKEFGVHWSGWVGRYYDNLDTLVNLDIPRWLIDNYKKDNQQRWPFSKSGIAFIREDDKIVILENKTHLNVEVPFIYTNETDAKHYGIKAKMKYPFWFDIVKADSNFHLISEYKIDPNSLGDSIMSAWNIPKTFPAAIYNNNYYYLAGDFCDNQINLRSSYFENIHIFTFVTATKELNERDSFFWKYYRPLTTTILKTCHTKQH